MNLEDYQGHIVKLDESRKNASHQPLSRSRTRIPDDKIEVNDLSEETKGVDANLQESKTKMTVPTPSIQSIKKEQSSESQRRQDLTKKLKDE